VVIAAGDDDEGGEDEDIKLSICSKEDKIFPTLSSCAFIPRRCDDAHTSLTRFLCGTVVVCSVEQFGDKQINSTNQKNN
jgi:hypothetical protein